MTNIEALQNKTSLDDKDLVDLFDELNHVCFYNALNRVSRHIKFEFETNGCLGIFSSDEYGLGGITINEKLRYAEISRLKSVLLHEMIHWHLSWNIRQKFVVGKFSHFHILATMRRDWNRLVDWILFKPQHGFIFSFIFIKALIKSIGLFQGLKSFVKMWSFEEYINGDAK